MVVGKAMRTNGHAAQREIVRTPEHEFEAYRQSPNLEYNYATGQNDVGCIL